MSISTDFYKNKELYLKHLELYDKMETETDILLDDVIYENYKNIEKQDNENTLIEYYNIFRTWKRDDDGYDTSDIISSKEECFKWLEDNSKFVSYKQNGWESSEVESNRKTICFEKLNEFWNKYPDGCITFC